MDRAGRQAVCDRSRLALGAAVAICHPTLGPRTFAALGGPCKPTPLPAFTSMSIAPLLLLACLSPGDRPAAALPIKEYTVDYGDSLWQIANRFDVPGGYQALARLNGVRNVNYIEAGQRLKVPSQSAQLPDWPKFSPRTQPLVSCAAQAIPVPPRRAGTTTSIQTVVDLGQGMLLSTAYDEGVATMAASYGGRPAWLHDVNPRASDWFDSGSAPNAFGDASQVVAYRAQLDGDPSPEIVVGWKVEANDLGMSRWQVAVFDDRAGGRATTFEAANFGPGSLVSGKGGACDVLASEWAMGAQPGESNEGYNLLARRMRLESGNMRLVADSGLLSRRLYHSFQPTSMVVGNVVAGAVSVDLSHPSTGVRSIEPAVQLMVANVQSVRLAAWEFDGQGHTRVNVGSGLEVVDAAYGSLLRRLGDRDSGLLYPVDFTPADPAPWVGKGAVRATYQPPWYGEPWSAAWIAG